MIQSAMQFSDEDNEKKEKNEHKSDILSIIKKMMNEFMIRENRMSI